MRTSNRLLARSCADRNKRANRRSFLVVCYNRRGMEIHHLKYISISLPSLSGASLREWLWHTRRAAPVLTALFMAMVLGLLGGQQRCSFGASLPESLCAVDGLHFQMAFAHAQTPSTDSPMPSLPGPSQSDEIHHCHCQFAVLLTLSTVVSLLALLGLKPAPRHVRLQFNLTPPSPPPRLTHL